MKKVENNYAFIDSLNLKLSIREQGWMLDFRRFRIYLKEKYGITKAFIFIGEVPKYHGLYTNLEKDGYILVFKPSLNLPSGFISVTGDALLELQAMTEFPNYDKALIVSGDGDFYRLVDNLLKKGKLLKLMVPNKNSFSSLFRKIMPHIVFMNNMQAMLEYKSAK